MPVKPQELKKKLDKVIEDEKKVQEAKTVKPERVTETES
jgi:hypothetical protein